LKTNVNRSKHDCCWHTVTHSRLTSTMSSHLWSTM